jgi:formylglycine-generating enzyme required for sulfatase activity
MAGDNEVKNKTPTPRKRRPAPAAKSRQQGFLPFLIAGLVCITTAFALGTGAWLLFGKRLKPEVTQTVVEPPPENVLLMSAPATPTPAPTPEPSPTPEKLQAEELIPPPPGAVEVKGGVAELGGQDPDNPARKVQVADFFIGEAEVTNEQFNEFVAATKHKAPITWLKDGVMPPNRKTYPVTGVTYQDAVDFCAWLSQKLGRIVRLPTEAEWELAARGPQKFLYPWGNEWQPKAAIWAGNGGKLQPVKTIAEGRSPSGAYDMAGNAWEWTSDNALNDKGKTLMSGVKFNKIVKGGAAEEARELISSTSRLAQVENGPHRLVGFRYVVERSLNNDSGAKATPSPATTP